MADTNMTGKTGASASAGEDLELVKQRAEQERRAAAEMAGEMRQSAAGTVEKAREEALRRGSEMKGRTAEHLRVFADAVRSAGDELAEKEPGPVGDIVRRAAEGLEEFSQTIEGSSPGEMVDGVRNFGRRNPVALFAGSMIAGFAIARFATSSSSQVSRGGPGMQQGGSSFGSATQQGGSGAFGSGSSGSYGASVADRDRIYGNYGDSPATGPAGAPHPSGAL